MIEIKTYTNESDSNVMNKVIANEKTYGGNFTKGTTVTDPVFDLDITTTSAPEFNYVYIPSFNRYYFVTRIVSVRARIWRVYCHVDVLMSWKTQILRNDCILARQENLYNLYLDDDRFLVNAKRSYWTKAFPNRVASASTGLANPYILTLAGGQPS